MRTNSLPWRSLAYGVVIAILFAPRLSAGPFSNLVVFGDSLSDVGNIDQATPSFFKFPGPYYYDGRFSNGSLWVESLALGLGLPTLTHSAEGGNNFAYGGAQTSGTGGFEGIFIRDVDEQVTQFLATRTIDPNALFVVYAGANDFIGGEMDVNVPVQQLTEDIDRLIAAGARQFLVPNLPLLGLTPRFNGDATTASQYNVRSATFNADLWDALDDREAENAALRFHQLDVAELIASAVDAPAAFGLVNVTDAAAPGLEPGDSSYNTNQIADEPNEYLFWDDLHPTAAVHEILAERALSLLFTSTGDYNGNGVVDAADYTVWRNLLGESGSSLAADGNGDRMITRLDYDVWKLNYGEDFGATGATTDSHASEAANRNVPEPTSALFALLAIAVCGLSVRVTPTHTPRPAESRCRFCA